MSEPAAPTAPAATAPDTAGASTTPAPAAAPAPTPAAAPASFFGDTQAPAAAPAPGSPPRFFSEGIAKDGQFVEGWTQNLQDLGFERLANKAALAKDEPTLLKSLDDALGLIGKKAGIAYPKAGADENSIAAYRADAGVPETPEGYNLKPAQLPEGISWDDNSQAAYAKAMHDNHIPAAAAEALVNIHLQRLTEQTAAAHEQFAAELGKKVELATQTFQKEWGGEFEARLEANRAFIQSRFSEAERQDPTLQAALSHPALVRIIDDARISLREAPLPGVGMEASSTTHSPRQQALEIMKANPGYRNDPALMGRINNLYALDHAQTSRKR